MPAALLFGNIQRDLLAAANAYFSEYSFVARLKEWFKGDGSTGLVSTWATGKVAMPVGAANALIRHAAREDREALATILLRGTELVVVLAPDVDGHGSSDRTVLLLNKLTGDLAELELAATAVDSPDGIEWSECERAARLEALRLLQRTVTSAIQRHEGAR